MILDSFGGTGTTALAAKAAGRHGITLDMSADYCRLAEWRVNDEAQLLKAAGLKPKAKKRAKKSVAPAAEASQPTLFDGEASA